MDKVAKFTTERGNEIVLISNGGLNLYVNDEMFHGGVDIKDDADYGKVLKPFFDKAVIPIPADALAAVEEVIADHKADVAAQAKSDRAYEAHVAGVMSHLNK